MPDVYALVRDLRQRGWSRNRHFYEHATHAAQRARRLHRFVDSLERDLRRATHIELERMAEGHRLTLLLPDVRMRRTVTVSDELLTLLREDPGIAQRLLPNG